MLTVITIKYCFKVSFVEDGTAIFVLIKWKWKRKKTVWFHKQGLLIYTLIIDSFHGLMNIKHVKVNSEKANL